MGPRPRVGLAAALPLLLLALLAPRLPAGGHPAPDVYFFYDLRIERGRLFLLHETRWTDLFAQEMLESRIDQDGDGQVSEAEGLAFAEKWAERVKASFRLEIQGEPVDLGEPEVRFDTHVPSEADLERAETLNAEAEASANLEAYQGTTWEFRVYLDFEIPLPAAAPIQLDLFEETYQEEEVVEGETQPWATNAISAYGEDGLTFLDGTRPDDPRYLTDHIQLLFDWSGRGPSVFEWTEFEDPNAEIRDALTNILLGRIGFILGLVLAFVYGMGHALAPGHGKAMVAAYLIGTRGRVRDAISLGLIVTATHTFAIVVLAFVTIGMVGATDSKVLQKWLGVASGAGIVLIGGWLVFRHVRALVQKTPPSGPGHHHGEPGPAHHDHAHHDHDPADPHHPPGHGPSDPRPGSSPPGSRHPHDPGPPPPSHSHSHPHHHHHHRTPTTLSELLALGISGGIVPCPAALIVFLLALQRGLQWKGLIVVLSFSVGLALVLVTIGLLMVTSSRLLGRVSRGRARIDRWLRTLPVCSAVAIVAVGVLVTYTAFATGPR